MTVNESCEWVEIELPEKIESGSMLYITFTEGAEDNNINKQLAVNIV